VVAGATLLAPWGLSYDPWAWLVWGRDIAHLDLQLGPAPSWKPFPVLFTTVFSFAGDAGPALWAIVARAGALFALVMAARLAARLAPGPLRMLASATAVVGLLLVKDFVRRSALANAEPLMLAFALLAIERHLDGQRRQAFACAFAAALVRPEIWPYLGLYSVWLWFAERRARALIVAALALIPLLWLGGAYWGSGNAFQSSDHVLMPGRPAPGALTQHHGSRAFTRFVEIMPPALPLLALTGLALSWRRRVRERTLIALAGAAAASWVVMLAIMVERGYTVIPRYLFLPAALVAILAGVGMVRIVEPLRARARTLAIVAVGVLALAASADHVDLVRNDPRYLDLIGVRDRDLGAAVDRIGGAEAVLACGAPVTEWWEVPVLAWQLDTSVSDVRGEILSGPSVRFGTRGGSSSDSGAVVGHAPPPAGAQHSATRYWTIVADCRPGARLPLAAAAKGWSSAACGVTWCRADAAACGSSCRYASRAAAWGRTRHSRPTS
jgi:hypothetical protein